MTKEVFSVSETWKPEAKASRSSDSQSFQFPWHWLPKNAKSALSDKYYADFYKNYIYI